MIKLKGKDKQIYDIWWYSFNIRFCKCGLQMFSSYVFMVYNKYWKILTHFSRYP